MKRSKIALGMLALVFAVGSSFVTKASTRNTDYFFISTGDGLCHKINLPITCTEEGTGCKNGTDQLYQTGQDGGAAGTCQTTLFN